MSFRNIIPFSELDTNVLKLYLGGATICKRLMQITPKSCDNLFAVLGSQLHAWLLFYALPVLREILPSPYFDHLFYLVVSMHIILSDYISPASLSHAHSFQSRFFKRIPQLYGKCIFL